MPPTQHPPPAPRLPLSPPAVLLLLTAPCRLSACFSDGAVNRISTLLLCLPPRQPWVGQALCLPWGALPLGSWKAVPARPRILGPVSLSPQCGPHRKEKLCSMPWCSLTLSHWIPARSGVAAEATF